MLSFLDALELQRVQLGLRRQVSEQYASQAAMMVSSFIYTRIRYRIGPNTL